MLARQKEKLPERWLQVSEQQKEKLTEKWMHEFELQEKKPPGKWLHVLEQQEKKLPGKWPHVLEQQEKKLPGKWPHVQKKELLEKETIMNAWIDTKLNVGISKEKEAIIEHHTSFIRLTISKSGVK